MRLQKSPVGLLAAFALKVDGNNPQQFGDGLQPVIDVFDHYLANELVKVSNTVTVAGGSGVTTLTSPIAVPEGRMYRVLAVGMSSALAVGDAAIVVRHIYGTNNLATGLTDIVPFFAQEALGNSTGRLTGRYLSRPLLLPPGWRLTFTVGLSAGPASNLQTSVHALVQDIVL